MEGGCKKKKKKKAITKAKASNKMDKKIFTTHMIKQGLMDADLQSP